MVDVNDYVGELTKAETLELLEVVLVSVSLEQLTDAISSLFDQAECDEIAASIES